MKRLLNCVACIAVMGVLVLTGCDSKDNKNYDTTAAYKITDVHESETETVGTVVIKIPDLKTAYDKALKKAGANADADEILNRIEKEMDKNMLEQRVEVPVCKDENGEWKPVSENEITKIMHEQTNELVCKILSEMDFGELNVTFKEGEQ